MTDALSAAKKRALGREVLASYIAYADSNGLPLILIAGDLLDSRCVTRDTEDFLLDLFSHTKADIVIAPGNHDPYTPDSPYALLPFPPNVHIFRTQELSYFDLPSARIYGYAFTAPNMYSCALGGFHTENHGKPNLLAAHADLDAPTSPYCPTPTSLLVQSGIDYAAFGHIHKCSPLRHAGQTAFCYCGCTVGHDFGETGKKGALLCEIPDDHPDAPVTVTFLESGAPHFEERVLTLHGEAAPEAAADALAALTADCADEKTILRLRLRGHVNKGFFADEKRIASLLPKLAGFKLVNETVPFDAAALENDVSVAGVFYRRLKADLIGGSDERREIARRALYYGLSVLDGHDLTDLG